MKIPRPREGKRLSGLLGSQCDSKAELLQLLNMMPLNAHRVQLVEGVGTRVGVGQ